MQVFTQNMRFGIYRYTGKAQNGQLNGNGRLWLENFNGTSDAEPEKEQQQKEIKRTGSGNSASRQLPDDHFYYDCIVCESNFLNNNLSGDTVLLWRSGYLLRCIFKDNIANGPGSYFVLPMQSIQSIYEQCTTTNSSTLHDIYEERFSKLEMIFSPSNYPPEMIEDDDSIDQVVLNNLQVVSRTFSSEEKTKGSELLFIENPNSIYFKGEFKDNFKHGVAVEYFVNGYKFEGNYKRGMKNGHGVLTSLKGTKYDAYWKQNEIQGKGNIYYYNGNKYEGGFQHNMRYGDGWYRLPDGIAMKGFWKEDQPTGDFFIYYPNKDYLKCPISNLLPEGKGLYQSSTGKKLEGMYKHGKKNGKFTITYSNYRSIQATFVDDVMEGNAEMELSEGKYYGQIQEDKRHGFGRMEYLTGDVYEGEWKEDKKNGKGTLKMSSGMTFTGIYKDEKKNGEGILTLEDGTIEKGYFKEDLKNGTFFIKAKDMSLTGNYVEDKREGEWLEAYKDRTVVREYKDDRPLGKGKMNLHDQVYIGEIEGWNREGKGENHWPNGDVYVGEWKQDQRWNHGVMHYVGGSQYDGEWCRDQYHGYGVMKWSNGDVYEGEWKENCRSGYGVMKYMNGDVYKGFFLNDEYFGHGMLISNQDTFVGDWKYHMKWGNFRVSFHNGRVFVGPCEKNVFLNGMLYLDDGVFEGKITETGERVGEGKFIDQDQNIYIGFWVNDHKSSFGVQYNRREGTVSFEEWSESVLKERQIYDVAADFSFSDGEQEDDQSDMNPLLNRFLQVKSFKEILHYCIQCCSQKSRMTQLTKSIDRQLAASSLSYAFDSSSLLNNNDSGTKLYDGREYIKEESLKRLEELHQQRKILNKFMKNCSNCMNSKRLLYNESQQMNESEETSPVDNKTNDKSPSEKPLLESPRSEIEKEHEKPEEPEEPEEPKEPMEPMEPEDIKEEEEDSSESSKEEDFDMTLPPSPAPFFSENEKAIHCPIQNPLLFEDGFVLPSDLRVEDSQLLSDVYCSKIHYEIIRRLLQKGYVASGYNQKLLKAIIGKLPPTSVVLSKESDNYNSIVEQTRQIIRSIDTHSFFNSQETDEESSMDEETSSISSDTKSSIDFEVDPPSEDYTFSPSESSEGATRAEIESLSQYITQQTQETTKSPLPSESYENFLEYKAAQSLEDLSTPENNFTEYVTTTKEIDKYFQGYPSITSAVIYSLKSKQKCTKEVLQYKMRFNEEIWDKGFNDDEMCFFPVIEPFRRSFARDSFGYFKFRNGDYYTGDIKNYMMHGLGCYYEHEKGLYYGYFENNERHGYGVYRYNNGTTSMCTWVHGLREDDVYIYYDKSNSYYNAQKQREEEGSEKVIPLESTNENSSLGNSKIYNLSRSNTFNTSNVISWEDSRRIFEVMTMNYFNNYNARLRKKENHELQFNLDTYQEDSDDVFNEDSTDHELFDKIEYIKNIFTTPFTGDLLKCTCIHGSIEGPSIILFEDGDIFVGNYIQNKLEGIAQMNLSGNEICVNFYQNDREIGLSYWQYENKNIYIGEMHYGVPQGLGMLIYSNGDRYEGYFNNYLCDGYGILYSKNRNEVLIGQFKNNVLQGNGVLFKDNARYFELLYQCNREKFIQYNSMLDVYFINKANRPNNFTNQIMKSINDALYHKKDIIQFLDYMSVHKIFSNSLPYQQNAKLGLLMNVIEPFRGSSDHVLFKNSITSVISEHQYEYIVLNNQYAMEFLENLYTQFSLLYTQDFHLLNSVLYSLCSHIQNPRVYYIKNILMMNYYHDYQYHRLIRRFFGLLSHFLDDNRSIRLPNHLKRCSKRLFKYIYPSVYKDKKMRKTDEVKNLYQCAQSLLCQYLDMKSYDSFETLFEPHTKEDMEAMRETLNNYKSYYQQKYKRVLVMYDRFGFQESVMIQQQKSRLLKYQRHLNVIQLKRREKKEPFDSHGFFGPSSSTSPALDDFEMPPLEEDTTLSIPFHQYLEDHYYEEKNKLKLYEHLELLKDMNILDTVNNNDLVSEENLAYSDLLFKKISLSLFQYYPSTLAISTITYHSFFPTNSFYSVPDVHFWKNSLISSPKQFSSFSDLYKNNKCLSKKESLQDTDQLQVKEAPKDTIFSRTLNNTCTEEDQEELSEVPGLPSSFFQYFKHYMSTSKKRQELPTSPRVKLFEEDKNPLQDSDSIPTSIQSFTVDAPAQQPNIQELFLRTMNENELDEVSSSATIPSSCLSTTAIYNETENETENSSTATSVVQTDRTEEALECAAFPILDLVRDAFSTPMQFISSFSLKEESLSKPSTTPFTMILEPPKEYVPNAMFCKLLLSSSTEVHTLHPIEQGQPTNAQHLLDDLYIRRRYMIEKTLNYLNQPNNNVNVIASQVKKCFEVYMDVLLAESAVAHHATIHKRTDKQSSVSSFVVEAGAFYLTNTFSGDLNNGFIRIFNSTGIGNWFEDALLKYLSDDIPGLDEFNRRYPDFSCDYDFSFSVVSMGYISQIIYDILLKFHQLYTITYEEDQDSSEPLPSSDRLLSLLTSLSRTDSIPNLIDQEEVESEPSQEDSFTKPVSPPKEPVPKPNYSILTSFSSYQNMDNSKMKSLRYQSYIKRDVGMNFSNHIYSSTMSSNGAYLSSRIIKKSTIKEPLTEEEIDQRIKHYGTKSSPVEMNMGYELDKLTEDDEKTKSVLSSETKSLLSSSGFNPNDNESTTTSIESLGSESEEESVKAKIKSSLAQNSINLMSSYMNTTPTNGLCPLPPLLTNYSSSRSLSISSMGSSLSTTPRQELSKSHSASSLHSIQDNESSQKQLLTSILAGEEVVHEPLFTPSESVTLSPSDNDMETLLHRVSSSPSPSFDDTLSTECPSSSFSEKKPVIEPLRSKDVEERKNYWKHIVHAELCHILYSNGNQYTGNCIMSIREGQGVLTYKNGSIYKGEFCNNLPHGKGTFVDASNHAYEGTWNYGYYYNEEKDVVIDLFEPDEIVESCTPVSQ